jgi:hypothetical protein
LPSLVTPVVTTVILGHVEFPVSMKDNSSTLPA